MKIIVEENAGCAEEIKIEYTPTEALIINHAMRRYTCDEDVSANNRGIMERMLETEPIFMDKAAVCDYIDVLDKIQVEVADAQLIGYATINGKREIASKAVMEIIDKYRGKQNE